MQFLYTAAQPHGHMMMENTVSCPAGFCWNFHITIQVHEISPRKPLTHLH